MTHALPHLKPPALVLSTRACVRMHARVRAHTHTLNTPSSFLITLKQTHSFIFLEFLLHIFPIAITTLSLHRNDSQNILFCQNKYEEEKKVILMLQSWNEMKEYIIKVKEHLFIQWNKPLLHSP